MEFLRATINDLNELVRNRLEMRKERENLHSLDEENELRISTEEFYISNISNESFIAWIAVEKGTVVATSGMSFFAVPPTYKNLSGRVGYLMNMYTQPAYRKRGIASILLDKVVLEARCRGCGKIVLNASEMGRPLYEKYGFKDMKDEMVLYLD